MSAPRRVLARRRIQITYGELLSLSQSALNDFEVAHLVLWEQNGKI